MDILLVNSIYFSMENIMPQLGSICLYDKLSEFYDVEIINFDYLFFSGSIKYSDNMKKNINIFAEYILKFNPKIVQFYTICMSYPLTLLIAKKVKELNKGITIIMGGPQATATAIESLNKFKFIDVIGLQEGESYILDLITSLMNNKSIKHIRGIAFRIGSKCYYNKCDKIVNSNELGVYTKFNFRKYLRTLKKVGKDLDNYQFQIESGRGCPFNCSFCSSSIFWQRKFRVKPANKIVDEIEYFHQQYGFLNFSLDHDMFTANKRYLVNFCDLLSKRNLNVRWGCSSRLDSLDDEMLYKMKQSNCTYIYVGFETGSKQMQKRINKNLNIESAIETLKKIKKLGFKVTVSFIYGFLEETENDFFDTIKIIEKLYDLGIDIVQLHKFFPLSSTNEFDKIKNLYINTNDIDISIYNKSIYAGILDKFILNNSNIFSCFYSFESIVRKKYIRFDLLITCITIMKPVYKRAIEYFLKKDGLLSIYNKCKIEIELAYKKLQSRTIYQYTMQMDEKEILHELLISIFDKLLEGDNNEFIHEVIRFETIFYNYLTDKGLKNKIYLFDVNVLDIEKGIKKYTHQKCFIKFEISQQNVLVKKMKIDYNILKHLID